ncbi:MAG: DsbA family protein [bacterium]|nr:DsbA family protein [bacterium]
MNRTMRRWYRQPLVIAAGVYVLITVALGLWLLIARRGAGDADGVAGSFTSVDRSTTAATGIPLGVTLYTDTHPSFGNAEDPALVIVEFSDFQCPYCRQAYPVIREIAARYEDRIRYVYRDFPIEELHPNARQIAEAARCANAQGKFWPYHDQLFLRQDTLDDASVLTTYAEQVGLDRIEFTQCLATQRYAAAVEQDLQDGLRLGVRGTPTWFFIPNGDITKAQKVEGVIPREQLLNLLEHAL